MKIVTIRQGSWSDDWTIHVRTRVPIGLVTTLVSGDDLREAIAALRAARRQWWGR